MIRLLAIALAAGAIVAALVQSAGAQRVAPPPIFNPAPSPPPSPPPSYIPFYTSAPSPIPSAYAAIGGAFGAANVYNVAGTPGTAMLNSRACYFICYGEPGVASVGVLAMGNDVSSGSSFTTLGAPDDCDKAGSSPQCPAGIADRVFAIENWTSSTRPPTVVFAIDQFSQLGVSNGIYANGPIVAGVTLPVPSPGTQSPPPPFPSPNPGSLVSFTGIGQGDLLLGSASDFVKCDYGESAASMLTCNKPIVVTVGANSAGINAAGTIWATGGVQPHSSAGGASGGYAPEAFPDGIAEPHPQIITGSCQVTGYSQVCPFSNGFAFASGSYECTVSAQGGSAAKSSYDKNSTGITIHADSSALFSYTCIG